MTSQDHKLEFIRAQLRYDNPTWTNERIFTTAMTQAGHQGSFGRDPVDSSTKLIAIATNGAPAKEGQHPSVARELNRHAKLDQSRKSSKISEHVARLAKIRQLMENDPSLSFDSAFTRIVQEENAVSPAVKTSQSTANGNGKLMLVKGSDWGMRYPIFK
jgi:hypothetical protein